MANNLLEFKRFAKYFPAPIRSKWGAFIDAIIAAGPGYTDDPTGFPSRIDSSIDFDDGTRIFTIGPKEDSFLYLFKGELITVSEAHMVTIPSTEGLHHVFFDEDEVLVASMSVTITDLLRNNVYVANIYWSATDGAEIIVGDERHGLMPWQVHEWLHLYEGTKHRSGLGFSGILVDQDGSSDTHVQFNFGGGEIQDEDIVFALQGLAAGFDIRIIAKIGTGPSWTVAATNDAPIVLSGGIPQINTLSGSTWGQTSVSSSKFFLAHIFATNEPGFLCIQGEVEYNSKIDARNGATVEIGELNTEGLPMQEFLAIGTFIIQHSPAYTNTYSSRFVSTDLGDDYVSWL